MRPVLQITFTMVAREKKKRLMSLFIRNEEQILPYMLPTYQHTHLEEDFCIREKIKREPCLALRINIGRGKRDRSKATGQKKATEAYNS